MQSDLSVLLIDMQEPYVRNIAHEERRTLVRSQMRTLLLCAKYDIPTIVLEYRGDGPTIEPLASAVRALPRHSRVEKSSRCAFFKTELHTILRARRSGHLIVMGTNTSACVRDSVAGALRLGYGVSTSPDLIADPETKDCSDTVSTHAWLERTICFHASLDRLLVFHGLHT